MLLATLSFAWCTAVVVSQSTCDSGAPAEECDTMGCGFVEGSGGGCFACPGLPADATCSGTVGCAIVGGSCGDCKDVTDSATCNATPGCLYNDVCMTKCEDATFVDDCVDDYISAGGCDLGDTPSAEDLGKVLSAMDAMCLACENVAVEAEKGCDARDKCGGLAKDACNDEADCEFNQPSGSCVPVGESPICEDITRGRYCSAQPNCFWHKKGSLVDTCVTIACEKATSRKQCLGHFKEKGVMCAMPEDECVDKDPENCTHLSKEECRAAVGKCEFNRSTEKCVDMGAVPCSDYTKGQECVKAAPTSAPYGCTFDKTSKVCSDQACANKNKKTGCISLGCNWDGSTCSDPSDG